MKKTRPTRRRRRSETPASRGHLLTEQRHPGSADLDGMSIAAAFDLMNAEDRRIPAAVAKAKPAIIKAVALVSRAWRRGGRLIYVGAGTSGRLGVLDAAECPPTFRSDPRMVRGLIAGGRKALWRSVEGAEDDEQAARIALDDLRIGRHDVIMGIATGGTTPFVHTALAYARSRRAMTVFLACVPRSQVRAVCDVDIRVLVGPEILSGSTRLKAGTATKLVLNAITTLSMVRIGKTFGNLMVDLNSYACRKLTERATRVVAAATGASSREAAALLRSARGRAKTAIIMKRCGLSRTKAEVLLDAHHGHVRSVLRNPARPSTRRRP
jgi:N-acetylmuramic acid 6-phosphate etherase